MGEGASDEIAAGVVPARREPGKLAQMRVPRSSPTGPLSARELEVLRLVAKTMSNDEIAADLYLSVHTVRNHVSSVLAKLGAHSRLQAVAIAVRDGILTPAEIG